MCSYKPISFKVATGIGKGRLRMFVDMGGRGDVPTATTAKT